MRVAIACPAPAGSRLGNRITAVRWQRILTELGHDVALLDVGDVGDVGDAPQAAGGPRGAIERDGPFDVLVALHARRSAHVVRASRAERPERRVVVALTGTDLYLDLKTSASARSSLELADRLVVLHDLAPADVPSDLRHKVRVIRQSAEAAPGAGAAAGAPASDDFEVAFVAHARPEKDPLRAALAVRALPSSSKIRVVHAGRALSNELEVRLRAETRDNDRYRWLGEIDAPEALRLIARAKLLVLTSEIEGGANVLGEAIVAGTPPLASRIPASVAALGAEYPGLFPVGDTAALTQLLARAETDAVFYGELAAASRARQPLFTPSVERDAWRDLLDGLAPIAKEAEAR